MDDTNDSTIPEGTSEASGAAPGEVLPPSAPTPPPPPESEPTPAPQPPPPELTAPVAEPSAETPGPSAETPEPSAEASEPDDEGDDDEEPSFREIPRHFTAPAMIALDRIDEDDTFRIRTEEELEEVAALATDIARLGQLFPIDVRLKPPDRFQIISGFRRVAALRFLKREKVLARLHTDLSDADAMLLSLASAIHVRSVSREALEAARARLEGQGRLTPAARDMLDKALAESSELAPESVEEEVDADELAADASLRLGQINQDLALLADVFADLDSERREELLKQLRYSSELVSWLESKA